MMVDKNFFTVYFRQLICHISGSVQMVKVQAKNPCCFIQQLICFFSLCLQQPVSLLPNKNGDTFISPYHCNCISGICYENDVAVYCCLFRLRFRTTT